MKDPKFIFADEICDLELSEEDNDPKHINDEVPDFDL